MAYYEALKRRAKAVAVAKREANAPRVAVTDCIAPAFLPLHEDVVQGLHSTYYLPGGRGSGKSSFVSLEIVDGIMNDPEANGIVFRRTAATMRESVYTQIAWAISELGAGNMWRGSVSPMQFTYLPTQQQIIFRGLDDAGKLKSIKPRHGTFKYAWFEEFSELTGQNQVRNVRQSIVRGGEGFRVFASFNPPMSRNNWANKVVLQPDPRALTFRSDYTQMPAQWLGEEFVAEAEALKAINERAYRHEYLGEATGSGGEVFPTIEQRTITDEEIKHLQYTYCGLDWGFSVDPFAFVVVAYDARTRTVYLLDELYQRGLSNREIAELIKAKGYHETGELWHSAWSGTAYREKRQIVCDSAEPKSISDLVGMGIKATGCTKYAGSVRYGVHWLQGRRIVIDGERTPHALEEFTTYEYCQTRDGEFTTDLPDKNNHCIDATRYALDQVINSGRNAA